MTGRPALEKHTYNNFRILSIQGGCAGPVPNLMQAVLWMWPAMYRSIYGRFLPCC